MKTLYRVFAIAATMFFAVNATAQLSAPINFPLPPNISAANVSAAEWYFDADPGWGNGSPILVSSGNNISVSNFSVAIDTLSTGVHHLYLRVKNSDNIWSSTNAANFFIVPQGALIPANETATQISDAEYFLDNDPGLGNGTNIPVTIGTDISAGNIAVPISTLSTGAHRIYVRVKNTTSRWSITNIASFYVVQGAALFPANPTTSNIAAAEYFLDTDPGKGNGTNIPITAGADISANAIAVSINTLSVGVHRIYVRTKNTNGNWSVTNVATFYIVPVNFSIPPNVAVGNITALEYFFDTDPGFGNGTMISINPTTDLSDYQIVADISGLQQDTIHTLYVRALDGWSQTTAQTFKVGNTSLPVKWISFTGKLLTNNNIQLQWQVGVGKNVKTYNIERSTDGVYFQTLGTIKASDENATYFNYSYEDSSASVGNHFYRIKATELNGTVIYSPVIMVLNNLQTKRGFYIVNNPAKSILRVHINQQSTQTTLQIFDLNGKLLLQKNTDAAPIQQLYISNLSSGAYILKAINKTNIESVMFIKL